MENKLLLFSILVIICSALVESFPHVEENYRLEANQVPDWPNVQNVPQNNFIYANYQPNSIQQSYQEIPTEQWTKPQYQNLNPALNNVPSYYPESLSQVSQNPRSQQSNFWSENSYKLPQSFENSPEFGNSHFAPEKVHNVNYLPIDGHQQIPVIQNVNNAPIEGWWNHQVPQQQSQNPLAETLLHSYNNMYPYPDQQQQIFQNYNPHHQHTPLPILANPVDSFNSYGQGWQNHYQPISISSFMEYPVWPVPGNQNTLTSGSQQTKALQEPLAADSANSNAKLVKVDPEPVNQNDHNQFVSTQHPVIEQDTSFPKRYIIVHMNGTYEHVANIDHVLVDVPHNNSKDVLSHVLAIIEVENNVAPETTYQQPLEQPYDTGISKLPQDTNWSSNNGEYPGAPHTSNSDSWGKQLYELDSILTTTENTTSYIMNYFQPKYIMPIESTTENSDRDGSANTLQQPTKVSENTTTNKNTSENLYTVQTTEVPQSKQNGLKENERYTKPDSTQSQSTIDHDIDSTTDNSHHITKDDETLYTSPTSDTSLVQNFDDKNANYFKSEYIMPIQSTTLNNNDSTTEITTEFTRQTAEDATDEYNSNDYNTTQKSEIGQSGEDDVEVVIVAFVEPSIEGAADAQTYYGPEGTPAESFTSHTPNPTISNNRQTFPNADFNLNTKPSFEHDFSKNLEYEQTTPSPLANNNAGIGATPANFDSNSQEARKFREDLRIDPGDLKTVIDRPIVWFRPDKHFWNKVTKGDEAYDALALYNVQCRPQLIEKTTNVHHYPNGTQVIDYVETVWDSPTDLNPREVNSNRKITHAQSE